MSKEKNEPKNIVDQLDHANYRAVCAELEAVNLKMLILQRDAKELDLKRSDLVNQLCKKYNITEGDKILADGTIERQANK